MDALAQALTESLIGMMVTIVLLGILGAIFYAIGRFEARNGSRKKDDEPYVIAAAYHYAKNSPANKSVESSDRASQT